MRRYDLREYKSDFGKRLSGILKEAKKEETLIFLFETIEETALRELIGKIRECGGDVLNSLRFNEVDWTIVVRAKALNV